jgi:hypothetical protein
MISLFTVNCIKCSINPFHTNIILKICSMLSFQIIVLLHIASFVPLTLSQPLIRSETSLDPSESRETLEDNYVNGSTFYMNPFPIFPLELLKSDDETNNTYHIMKPGVPVPLDPGPVAGSSDCVVDNIIQGFGYDTNKQETGFSFIPPDPSGAAGINRLVSVVNRMIEVRAKNGTLVFRDDLVNFFTTGKNSKVFDLKVIYDEHEGRFVVVALQIAYSPNLSRILIAVSRNEKPDSASAWNFLAINSLLSIGGNSSWADYPGFEVDEAAVYVTVNMYSFTSSTFTGMRLWIIDKGVIGGFYDGGTSPFIHGPYNPYQDKSYSLPAMPAQVHGSSGVSGSIGTFLVGCCLFDSASNYFLQVATIVNPLTTPTFTVSSVNLGKVTQMDVPDAPQRGTSSLIEANDIRILDAVWRANKLWVTMTINPPIGYAEANQATAHWIRLDTNGGTVTLDDQGNLGGESFSAGMHTYYPAVAINKRGHVAFGYSASSPTLYAGAYGSILVGTTIYSFTIQGGKDSYLRKYGGASNRWGDYSGISVDPSDDSFWIFNQYADTRGSIDFFNEDGRWGTVWARVNCTAQVRVAFSYVHL